VLRIGFDIGVLKEEPMKHRRATFLLALLAISVLSLQMAFAQGLTQQTGISSQKKFSIAPHLRTAGCHPVEVRAISMGAVQPEVLTSLVAIKSFSDKPVTAIKVRWDIYKWDVGTQKQKASCHAAAEPSEIFLSGTTPLIELGRLVKGEIYNISSDPLRVNPPFPAHKVIFVELPIIAWDQLKSLSIDGSRGNLKDDYLGIVYVAEIHFEDGTRWEAETK
jgi:hypothetical protein